MDTIKKIVLNLAKRHMSNKPTEIAQDLGTIVLYENLGKINGYFNTMFRQKFIHVNNHLNSRRKLFTEAHELGHSILHSGINTPFLREHSYISVNKYEIEANIFAVDLLITDDEINELICLGYTNDQIAIYYGFHTELIDLRLRG